MKTNIAKTVKQFLKDNNFNTAVVKVKMMGDVIIIDNLGHDNAANIASIATKLNFRYMTESMAQLVH